VNQTFQRLANVGLGSAKFWLIRRGRHPETTLIFAISFLVYLHHPHACSIIPRIGLSSPHAPRQRKARKSKCCRQRVQLHTKRHVCLLPWPPWTSATSLICAPVVRAWGLHPSPTWSPPCPYILIAWPSDPRSLRTWAALHRGVHPPPGWRFA